MKKYFEIFKYSLKMKIEFLADYLFSVISFAIFIFVFDALWDYILQGKELLGYTKTELIWYIIIAEFVVFSSNRTYKYISDMVKNGDIAIMLIKPIDFIKYIFFDDLSVILKAIINLIFAILMGVFIAGPIQVTVIGILMFSLAIIISILIGIVLQIFVGLLSFYTEENDSFWLIIQKLMFFILFTPIEFYPSFVQKILYVLPTTYMIHTPAKILIDFKLKQSCVLLGIEAFTLVLLAIVNRIIYKRGVKKINANGG